MIFSDFWRRRSDWLLWLWYGSLAALTAYVLLTWQFAFDQPYHGGMFYSYSHVLTNEEGAPFVYRYVAYLLPDLLHRASGYSLQTAEAISRAFWFWISALALHAYVTPWLKRTGAIIAVLAFFSIASLLVLQISFEPSDPPAFCFLLLSLVALQRRRYGWLLLTLPVGLLFRETTLFFFTVWGVYFLFEPDRRRQLPYLLGALALCAGVYLGLRLILGFQTYHPYTLPANLRDRRWLVRVTLLFGVFLVLPWLTFRRAPRFLQYTVVLAPVVFALNLLFALAKDSRLWLPLVPVLIPLGLLALLDIKTDASSEPSGSP
jgi:hypothetical protein